MSAEGVEIRRDVQIPMDDGVQLAADLMLPAGSSPAPALLSFYPYHKDGSLGAAFAPPLRWFAEHGYASLMVDIRGTGRSGGQVSDPFRAEREGSDGAAAVRWAASRPWCDGNVGVWGVSYGAITALSTAAQRPEGLKAIAPIMGCPDMYSDWFCPGGCETALTTTVWGTAQALALQLAPPLGEDPGGIAQMRWRERLEAGAIDAFPWRRRPAGDDYWLECEVDLSAIEVPSFVIGGWRDVYPGAVIRTYEQIAAPRRLLMGPWLHELPEEAGFEPYDYFPELAAWWDRWLRGRPTEPAEPPVKLYVQGRGSWKHEAAWPPAESADTTLFLSAGEVLAERPDAAEQGVTYLADPTVGAYAGHIYSGARPLDQAPDDERSLVWTGKPLPEPMEITGSAEAVLWVAMERDEDLNLVVRLCDVAPDGSSSLIAGGCLNARRVDSPTKSSPSVLPFRYEIQIAPTSYELAADHRLRVCVSCSDFPRIWPTESNPRIHLFTDADRASFVRIPVVPFRAAPKVESPQPARADREAEVDSSSGWALERLAADDSIAVSIDSHDLFSGVGGIEEVSQEVTANVQPDNPDRARVETTVRIRRRLASGSEAITDVQSVATPAVTACFGRITLDGVVIFDRSWP